MVVGVRPHDLEVSPPEQGDLRGRIEIVEPLGSSLLIHVRIDGLGTELTRVIVGADKAMKADDEIGLRVHADRVHLFDENEDRIGPNQSEMKAASEPREIAMS